MLIDPEVFSLTLPTVLLDEAIRRARAGGGVSSTIHFTSNRGEAHAVWGAHAILGCRQHPDG